METSVGPALLFVATDFNPDREEEVNRWYDSRHVPQRIDLPGFRSARRYTALEGGPKYMALYDLDNATALRSEAYLSLSRPPAQTAQDRAMLQQFVNPFRAVMEQIHAAGHGDSALPDSVLLVVGLDPELGYEEEFNAWYNEEHIPRLTALPAVRRVRRFHALEGEPAYLAIWELTGPEVRHAAEWRERADTPWSERMRAHFRRRVDGIYRPLPVNARAAGAEQRT